MRLTGTLPCIVKRVGRLTKKYSNLPDRYIKRASEQVDYTAPDLIQYLPYQRKKKAQFFRFGLHRPWTYEFQNENSPDIQQPPQVFIEPIRDWSIFKGDRVEILVGKDKGKQGVVSQVIEERNWVIVSGRNWKYELMGKSAKSPGTYVRQEQPLLVTDEVALVDPSDNKCTKVVWRYTEEGDHVRVSARTGRILPLPVSAEETIDYKLKAAYLEGDKDTKKDVAEKVTFQPRLQTFEMDIMESMGIKEDRIPKKTYWY